MTLGDRLRSIRKRRGLSQRELAAASGVSLSLIRKIEQGEIDKTRMETLRQFATALDVPTTTLVDQPDAEQPAPDVVTRWEPVRRALTTAPDPTDEAPTVAGVTAVLDQLMPVFRANRYSELIGVLPGLIRDARALDGDGRTVRTRILNMTGTVLTHTHQYDTAELALERALDAADDRFEASAVVHNLSWLMIRRGRIAECAELATRWADELEPRMSRATHREIASWGWMLLRISLAAVRDNRPGDARDAIRLARAAAVVVGREFQPAGDFLRPFGPLMVTAKTAELAMIEDHPDNVLALADTIPPGAFRASSDNGNRHLLDVANAHARLGHTDDAISTLQQVRANAPEWLEQQRYARDVMRHIVARRRTLTAEMRELADAVRLEY